MAQLILTQVGSALGGPVGGLIGSQIGQAIDQTALNALQPVRQVGPRLDGVRLLSAHEGAAIPEPWGRIRLGGQVIWSARLKEDRRRTSASKTAPRTEQARYSLSFAVALGAGPLDGIGTIWADGQVMDLSGVNWRVYLGTDDQMPDPLIAAIEGQAPAFRGVAYLVFEDLPLEPYGLRVPQISAEVIRRPAGANDLERRIRAVNLIPGAGEFAYSAAPVWRREGLTRLRPENSHSGLGLADITVALDQMQTALPSLEQVNVVVSWFGDDLRAGACQIYPATERADKATRPETWSVAGQTRAEARTVSQTPEGRAVYGGSPSDASVVALIKALKARGLKVGLNPFVLMDIPAGRHPGQGAFPWRGRLSAGDQQASTAADLVRLFGQAKAADFPQSGGYTGPAEWTLRRQVLHLAALARTAGGVDDFIIGSEMRGLTLARGTGAASDRYPGVAAYQALLAEVRQILPRPVRLLYAADWSEYGGWQPEAGSLLYPLDALWADPALDAVGIDWYAPLTDWREGADHADARAGFQGADDPAYLAARVAGGEGYDWYYASEADRLAQRRTPITDGAYGAPGDFRVKALRHWWSQPHYERTGGERAATPTAWQPGAKPVQLVEIGCAAIDKGGNAPNLFLDPKSSESVLPPFSTGERNDRVQRRVLEALLGHFDGAAMADMMAGPAAVWCWDARPFPAFPRRGDIWGDAGNWMTGHWLNGRVGGAQGMALLQGLLGRAGFAADQLDLMALADQPFAGAVVGTVLSAPNSLSQTLSPLLQVWGIRLVETPEGGLKAVPVSGVGTEPPVALRGAMLAALGEDPAEGIRLRRVTETVPGGWRLGFWSADPAAGHSLADYGRASVTTRHPAGVAGQWMDLEWPLVLHRDVAGQVLAALVGRAERVRAQLSVPLSALGQEKLSLGAVVSLAALADVPGFAGVPQSVRQSLWRVAAREDDEKPTATLVPVEPGSVGLIDRPIPADDGDGPLMSGLHQAGAAAVAVVIETALPKADWIVVAGREPWARQAVYETSESGRTLLGTLEAPVGIGALLTPLRPGVALKGPLAMPVALRLEGAQLQSVPLGAMLEGVNRLWVQSQNGDWEQLGFVQAAIEGPDQWRITGILRGMEGTEAAADAGAEAGATVVVIPSLTQAGLSLGAAEPGQLRTLHLRAAGGDSGTQDRLALSARFAGIGLAGRRVAHLSWQRRSGGRRLVWSGRSFQPVVGFDLDPTEASAAYRVSVYDATSRTSLLTENTLVPVWTAPQIKEANWVGVAARGLGGLWGPEVRLGW
ncbi:MAG: glycoside hydrolase TIM-barrel-like domain-containing protein [Asticcacaulis sp.]